jgi:hypothetical protein
MLATLVLPCIQFNMFSLLNDLLFTMAIGASCSSPNTAVQLATSLVSTKARLLSAGSTVHKSKVSQRYSGCNVAANTLPSSVLLHFSFAKQDGVVFNSNALALAQFGSRFS